MEQFKMLRPQNHYLLWGEKKSLPHTEKVFISVQYIFSFHLFTHRRRNTSLVPTTYSMDRRATTFGEQMWPKSAWPTAMRHCAMSSVSWAQWMQWRQVLELAQMSNWPWHKLCLNISSGMNRHRIGSTCVFEKKKNILTKHPDQDLKKRGSYIVDIGAEIWGGVLHIAW